MVIKMDEIYISGVADYLNILEELGKEYPSHPTMNNPIDNDFLFRGMEDRDYKLLPSIYRTVETRVDTLPIINPKYLNFASERGILQSFIREASAYISCLDTHDYIRWVELAQHYGVPTRFLDWTENPLVALYFACESNKECDAVIWVLHKRNYWAYLNRCDANPTKNKHMKIKDLIENSLIVSKKDAQYSELPQFPLIYTPYYFDHRMSAQASWFMAWGNREQPFEDMIEESCYMKYEPPKNQERIYGQKQIEKFLYRLFIYPSEKQTIIRQLEHMGIHAKSLFPGLEGVGKYIERKYRFIYDEASRNE